MITKYNLINHVRDESIDILRSIAIIGIIIAHSKPNMLFTQLRGFDVVLMVFLSAVCAKGFDRENFNYFDFFTKRCFRLIFPVWIFFTLYYSCIYVVYYLPPVGEILSTYTFISDRYVWIIRILVILWLIAPFIWKYTVNSNQLVIVCTIVILLVISEYLFCTIDNLVMHMIIMTVPYGAVYILGLNINKFNKNQLFAMSLSLLGIFAAIAIHLHDANGNWIMTYLFKYPPRIYYISYSLGITILMWNIRGFIQKVVYKIHLTKILTYTGSHTYWLYLWHIPIVDIVGDSYNSFLRFIIIFGGAFVMVALQDIIVKMFVKSPKLQLMFKG